MTEERRYITVILRRTSPLTANSDNTSTQHSHHNHIIIQSSDVCTVILSCCVFPECVCCVVSAEKKKKQKEKKTDRPTDCSVHISHSFVGTEHTGMKQQAEEKLVCVLGAVCASHCVIIVRLETSWICIFSFWELIFAHCCTVADHSQQLAQNTLCTISHPHIIPSSFAIASVLL